MEESSRQQAKRVFTLSDFDFVLPSDLIAQQPTPQRSGSRLLDAREARAVDRRFDELPAQLQAGDLMVFNDTRVVNARLYGEKASGGKLEILVERVLHGNEVAAHMRASKKPRVGTRFALTGAPGTDDGLNATLLGRWPDEHGSMFRLLLGNDAGDDPATLMARHGHVPLPPYITRPDQALDKERYQTVFASNPGAVAAPTAALHFDQGLLDAIDARGVQRAFVTLHVGAGTFQPVKTENLALHQMHSEWYQVPVATQQAIRDCRARGGRIVAVGTTTVRTLESWVREIGVGSELRGAMGVRAESTDPLRGSRNSDPTPIAPFSAETKIFITPGFQFQLVDLLLTNFHLPKSSLMMLVSAFAGYDRIRALYHHAIEQRYRFFSYGDAMLLTRQASEVR